LPAAIMATTLEEFIYPTQRKLFKKLCRMHAGNILISKGNFILVRGTAPVMLVAHLDTVHLVPVRDICRSEDNNILISPQGIGGDDRCGVYALNTVYELTGGLPWLLFTCDEEVGGIGAEVFCDRHAFNELPPELDNLKFIVEIDRRGSNDAVYYRCHNAAFEDYITGKGFKTAHGSFSDISYIAPELGIAAVNLSSGYYNAHTLHEYINRAELEAVIEKVCEMVCDSALPDFPAYEYDTRFNDYYYDEDYYGECGCYGGGGWAYLPDWNDDQK